MATPSPGRTPSDDGASSALNSPETEDCIQVHANKKYMSFSPTNTNTNKSGNRVQSDKQSTNPAHQVDRIIVTSVSAGTASGRQTSLSEEDCVAYRTRLEQHIASFNEAIHLDDDVTEPIRIIDPWWEKGKIIIIPSTELSGRHVINITNVHLRLPGHEKIRASWNHQLPKTCVVSFRYELGNAKRDPRMLIEDPRSGVARMNRWKLEEKGLTFVDVSPDPNHRWVQFARVAVTDVVCDLIKKQRGVQVPC